MLIDSQLLFSDAQAITVDAASDNYLDLGIARNLFDGEPMAVVITVDVAADFTTGDETYEFQIETDAATTFNTGPTDVVVQAILATALTLGSQHIIPIPMGVTLDRYLRLYYNVGGTSPTVTVTAFLQPVSMISKLKHYADNVTIS